MKIDTQMSAVAYHVNDGPVTFSYAIDAHSAVARHPREWSHTPWDPERAAKARFAMKERHAEETALAKELGLPVPGPLAPDPLPPTPEEQAAIDEHVQAQAEAAQRLEDHERKEAEEKRVAEQVAADRALLATPPPKPDPNIRRPFGRKGELTEAEKAMVAKRQGA